MVANSSSSFVVAQSSTHISSIYVTYISIIDAHSCVATQDDVSIFAHIISWEPFPMYALFDTVSNQPIPYGYE
jgi:hypothetical protein